MFLKCIQLMMVLAIFNPFCCCTAGLFAADTQEASPMEHGCCTQAPDQAPNGGEQSNVPHDPDACPHKALKEYQATALKDTIATHHAFDYVPVLLTVLDFSHSASSDNEAPQINLTTASHAPPRPLSQVYCVYRI